MLAALAQAAETPPLSERLLIAIVGPLVSAILGTGVIGWLLWRISNKAEDRRDKLEIDRARNELDNELRHELLTPLLSATTELYMATQHYWRVKNDAQRSDQEKSDARKALDAQYLKSRTAVRAIEAKLEALFETDQPAVACHKVDDLLTVRYMQLVGEATEGLYTKNALGYEGKEHSGLSEDELRRPKTLLAAYHRAVRDLAPSILSTPLRRTTQAAGFVQGTTSSPLQREVKEPST